jgi:hypothetical protein
MVLVLSRGGYCPKDRPAVRALLDFLSETVRLLPS